MTLDELAQVGLNAPLPADRHMHLKPRERWFEAGKKAATDHMIAAMLRDHGAAKAVAEPSMQDREVLGKAALDVCLPRLKAHWNDGTVSASMNPSLDYMNVGMGEAMLQALAGLGYTIVRG